MRRLKIHQASNRVISLQSPPRSRYVRSRSTENMLESTRGATSGARSRIARLGKFVHAPARSPSQSPHRPSSRSPSSSPALSPAKTGPLPRYDSAESVSSSNEQSALLKEEDRKDTHDIHVFFKSKDHANNSTV